MAAEPQLIPAAIAAFDETLDPRHAEARRNRRAEAAGDLGYPFRVMHDPPFGDDLGGYSVEVVAPFDGPGYPRRVAYVWTYQDTAVIGGHLEDVSYLGSPRAKELADLFAASPKLADAAIEAVDLLGTIWQEGDQSLDPIRIDPVRVLTTCRLLIEALAAAGLGVTAETPVGEAATILRQAAAAMGLPDPRDARPGPPARLE